MPPRRQPATARVEKSELIKLVKDLSRKMDDFEATVDTLKGMKDSILDIDEQLNDKKQQYEEALATLEKDFHENKVKSIHQAAQDINKLLVSREEYDELSHAVDKLKQEKKKIIQDNLQQNELVLKEKLEQAMKIKQLQHDVEIAQIKAENEQHLKEIQNLKDSMKRMSEELESQKKLTADVAKMSRPVHSKEN
jgi:DNA repair exonuclease SbcCD ATPase subunit